jgi:ABC-type cobalamin/Fe3+-siderophores transport system ATPase subunit
MSRFLQFDNVAFSYPGMAEPLLGGVTAHFPEGAWTGIVGANGAGKTTLLKLAAGVLAPTEGHIRQIGSARYAVQRWQLTQSGNIVCLAKLS